MYIGQFNAGKEALWLKKFLPGIGLQADTYVSTAKTPVTITNSFKKDPVFHIWISNSIGRLRKMKSARYFIQDCKWG
jgi:hypothetical protein